MSETPPWRVAAIKIDVTVPPATTDARVAAVRRAVEHCTVHNSLQTPPAVSITTRAVSGEVGPGLRGGVLH
jgi:uncharacterized OsmC-like protein